MAMNADNLGAEIWDALETAGYVRGDDEDLGKAIWQVVAGAIVDHITSNAEVSSTVAAGIACSVDPGSHVGSTTGTGSATGTVS